MATKPAAGSEVQTISKSEVAFPVDFMKKLGEEAKEAAAVERPAVSKLSTSSGMLKYMGQPVAGNSMDVVILYGSHRNVWYGGVYDPDNIKNPDCFALSDTDEGMVPQASNPVNPTCDGCPKNEWGSDIRDGKPRKGKACKQSRRLVLMPAGAVEAGADAVKGAELAIIDMPVTSAKNYGGFVNTVAATVGVPGWCVVANLKLQQHPKNQFEMILTPLRTLPDVATVEAMRGRVVDAKRLALEPYDETSPTNSAVIQAERAKAEQAGKKF